MKKVENFLYQKQLRVDQVFNVKPKAKEPKEDTRECLRIQNREDSGSLKGSKESNYKFLRRINTLKLLPNASGVNKRLRRGWRRDDQGNSSEAQASATSCTFTFSHFPTYL